MNAVRNSKLLILATVAALIIAGGCKKEGPEKEGPKKLTGTVTYSKGAVQINSEPANTGDKVKQADTIKVGKKSMAVVQFGDGALITLKSGSVLEVNTLDFGKNGKPKVELDQKKGFSFNKIKKGYGNYKLKSPTSVAGVRGTAFSLKVAKSGKTSISLLEGKVQAVPVSKDGKELKDKAVELDEGQKVSASKKGLTKPKALPKKEKKQLSQLNKIDFAPVAKTDDAQPDDADKKDTPEQLIEVPKASQEALEKGLSKDKKAKAKPMTLEELKAKYGPISLIVTTTGKKYTGVFKQTNDKMIITTVKGKIVIPASQVDKITQLDN